MTADPSVRHVPKLAEEPPNCDPIFACQLCGRRGTLDQLSEEECPKRSGVIRRVSPQAGSEKPG
jgi:hypothetical protein